MQTAFLNSLVRKQLMVDSSTQTDSINFPIIIGIAGRKRHGKTTIAEYLNKYSYNSWNFADPLKAICSEIFSFTPEQLYGEDKELVDPYWGITSRKAFQIIGTDLFRDQGNKIIQGIDSDIWVKVIERKLLKAPIGTKVVFGDIRFPNEVALIKKLGGKIIRVKRVLPEIDDDFDQVEMIHKSELFTDSLEVDYEIINDGDKESLYKKIDTLLFNN